MYWLGLRNFFWMLSTKIQIFPKLFYKILNLAQIWNTKMSDSIFYLCFCYYFKAFFFEECGGKRNLVAASKIGRGKIIFILPDEFAIILVQLAIINIWGPHCYAPFRVSLEISQSWWQIRADYVSSIALKICWRSFLLFLGIWKGAKLGPEFEGWGIFRASSSPIGDVNRKKTEVATKALSLQRRPHCLGTDMVILRNPKAVIQAGWLTRSV